MFIAVHVPKLIACCTNTRYHHSFLPANTIHSPNAGPMLGRGPTLAQHWDNVSCLLGRDYFHRYRNCFYKLSVAGMKASSHSQIKNNSVVTWVDGDCTCNKDGV